MWFLAKYGFALSLRSTTFLQLISAGRFLRVATCSQQRALFGESYPSAEGQSVYSTTPVGRASEFFPVWFLAEYGFALSLRSTTFLQLISAGRFLRVATCSQQRALFGESYPSAEGQSVYSTTPVGKASSVFPCVVSSWIWLCVIYEKHNVSSLDQCGTFFIRFWYICGSCWAFKSALNDYILKEQNEFFGKLRILCSLSFVFNIVIKDPFFVTFNDILESREISLLWMNSSLKVYEKAERATCSFFLSFWGGSRLYIDSVYLSLPPTRQDLTQGQWPKGRLKVGIRERDSRAWAKGRALLVIYPLIAMWVWWA